MKKYISKSSIGLLLLFLTLGFTGCASYTTVTTDNGNYQEYAYNNPSWAPDYYPGARYYYLPDIEVYFDLATRNFVYLQNGQWYFSPMLPSFYAGFDLNTCYVVVLDRKVYQPWLHHQYYVSHYPRYYYVNYYDHGNIPYVRGFNENRKAAIYWPENQRSNARAWDDMNLRLKRNFSYSAADRRVQQEMTRRVQTERTNVNTRTGRTSQPVSPTTNTNQTRDNNNERTNSRIDDRNSTSVINNNSNRSQNNVSKDERPSSTRNEGRNTDNAVRNSSDRTQNATNSQNTSTRNDRNNSNPESTSTSRRSADVNYYGNSIGRPVRVESQMRNNEGQSGSRSKNTTTTNQDESSRSSNRNNSNSDRTNSSGRR